MIPLTSSQSCLPVWSLSSACFNMPDRWIEGASKDADVRASITQHTSLCMDRADNVLRNDVVTGPISRHRTLTSAIET